MLPSNPPIVGRARRVRFASVKMPLVAQKSARQPPARRVRQQRHLSHTRGCGLGCFAGRQPAHFIFCLTLVRHASASGADAATPKLNGHARIAQQHAGPPVQLAGIRAGRRSVSTVSI